MIFSAFRRVIAKNCSLVQSSAALVIIFLRIVFFKETYAMSGISLIFSCF